MSEVVVPATGSEPWILQVYPCEVVAHKGSDITAGVYDRGAVDADGGTHDIGPMRRDLADIHDEQAFSATYIRWQ